jgi:type IX secretion system substrate protein
MRLFVQKFQAIVFLILAMCISQNALSQCGYDIELTTSDLTIQGNIFNTQNYGPDTPQELAWFISGTGYIFSNASSFEFSASSYGTCTICVDYTVNQQNGFSCTETICRNVNLIDPTLVFDCDQMDCVWPGDTNKDGAATLEDMINIGVGFGMTGEPRDSVSNDWSAQAATDWYFENADGVNYKHFDCNGDGTVEINDILAIQSNFTMLDNGVSVTEPGGVPISLSFDVDTVVITEENQELEINAGLNFGSSDLPMNDVYAVVLYLTYPKHYVVQTEPVHFDYNQNSFFGDMTTTIPMARNIQEEGQMDIVLTRKTGANTSGQGRVASLNFIIDSDIIDGRVENEGETFEIGINVVKAIDFEGNVIDISLPTVPLGVFFQNGISTKTVELIDESSVRVFPNPVNEILQIALDGQLHPEEIEIFNLMGQRVINRKMNNNTLDINVSQLSQGIYVLKVKTEEGIGSKKIAIE